MADRVAVMYGGRIVEQATVADAVSRRPRIRTRAGCWPRFPAARPGARLSAIPGTVPALGQIGRPAARSRRAAPTASSRATSQRPTRCRSRPGPRRALLSLRSSRGRRARGRRDAARRRPASRQGVPGARRAGSRKRRRRARGRRRDVRDRRRARRSAWSANPARGKTTTGRCVLRLIEPTSGEVRFKDMDVRALSTRRAAPRAPALSDRLSGSVFVAQPAHARRRHRRGAARSSTSIGTRDERRARVRELFELVGLDPAAVPKYPHEFSGGQRQRIGLARALALEPSLIVCRRAGVGARRVGAGAGRQPAARSAEAAGPDVSLHRARSAAGPADLQSRRRDVPRPHRRAGAGRARCSTRRRIRTRRRCSRRFRGCEPGQKLERIPFDGAAFTPRRRCGRSSRGTSRRSRLRRDRAAISPLLRLSPVVSGDELSPQASGRGNRCLRTRGIRTDAHRAGAYSAWSEKSTRAGLRRSGPRIPRSLRPGFRLTPSRPSHSAAILSRHDGRRNCRRRQTSRGLRHSALCTGG